MSREVTSGGSHQLNGTGRSAASQRAQLRRIRRFLNGNAAESRGYFIYVTVLVLALVVSPALWSAVLVLAQTMKVWTLAQAMSLSSGILVGFMIAALATPAFLGPVWTSAQEIFYLLRGQFSVPVVLRKRNILYLFLITMTITVTATIPVLGWVAGHAEGIEAETGSTAVAHVAGMVAVALPCGLLVGLLALWKQTGYAGIRERPGESDLLGVQRLDTLTTQRDMMVAGLLIGDPRSLTAVIPRRGPRLGGQPALNSPGLLRRSLAVDLRYLRRDWPVVLVACAAQVSGVAAFCIVGASGVSTALLMVLTQVSAKKLSPALGDVADTLGFDAVVPQHPRARLAAHLLLPGVLFALASLPLLGNPDVLVPGLAAVMAGLGMRISTLGVGGVPVDRMTPMSTPIGDPTAVFMVFWLLKEWMPALVLLASGLFLETERPMVWVAAGLIAVAVARIFVLGRRRI